MNILINFLVKNFNEKYNLNKIDLEDYFLYQTNKSVERVKKILDINKSNIKLIDLSIITENSNNSKINVMTQYSENGISLRGVDV